MTEWKTWPSWRRLVAIARAPVAGSAAATGSLAAGSLADLVESIGAYAPEGYPVAIEEIAAELLRQQPEMAPIVGLVNAVFLRLPDGPDELAAELRSMEARMAASTGLLAAVGSALVEPGSAVLTHGGSGSVKAMLVLAAESRRFSVSCAATLPLGEGVELAADLAAEGLRVEVVPDEQVLETLPGVDLVVMGANAFGPDHAMNVIGSSAVVEEAGIIGLPIYLVASLEKALPALLFERAAGSVAGSRRFETVPLEMVTGLVTEVGILDPESAGKLAADRRVAPALVVG